MIREINNNYNSNESNITIESLYDIVKQSS